jgi:type II secretory pathway pseudopilin PulG
MRTCHPSIWLIAIVAVASGVAAIHYRTQEQRAKYQRAGVDIASLQADLEQFRRNFGAYPTTAEGLRTLFGGDLEDPGFVRGVVDPQLPTADPWGHRYFYQSDGEHYVLGSFGPRKGGDPDQSLIVHSN